ncbi:MAG: universal stress protein [Gammaproteobacteria bacterium]|nr:universal stress protein [Gammaproteobacteria bacterium]
MFILSVYREHDVGPIVLGGRGLSDSKQHLLGGVAHKVTSLADCHVMVG